LNATFTAAAALGDTLPNNGLTYLRVKNGHSVALTVTAVALYACNHGFLHNTAVSIPAGGEREIGPFAVTRFGEVVSLTYSNVTLLTVAAVSL
jgi:hypothetical protein